MNRLYHMARAHFLFMTNHQPLTINTFPRAILHIDGDAFFASCEQSRDPKLQGKPVICGKERGIAASMSYEAKALGVTRGMSLREIKKVCPQAILLPSDYETYSLLSLRFYDIVRRYTPDVEEYGIDECFADITGLRRLHRTSYTEIAKKLKDDLDRELNFTFSAGLGPNKVIAKIGSKYKKPSGLTAIPGRHIHKYIDKVPIEKVWGIGPQTSALLMKYGVRSALDFARKPEQWVRQWLTKPFYAIWHELNGRLVFELETEPKQTYATIQKVKTFTPPSSEKKFIFSQLSKNIENACMKARRYNLEAKKIIIFLKTQQYDSFGAEIKFSRPSSLPHEVIPAIEPAFNKVFNPRHQYRATGAVLEKLEPINTHQPDLFGYHFEVAKMTRLYQSVDEVRRRYGKHTLFLGSSFAANNFSQHLGDRGNLPERKQKLLPGETGRKRLSIPMWIGQVK